MHYTLYTLTNWDKKFIALAEHVSEWSKDQSKKVGCVIVNSDNRIMSLGYNGFCSGINDSCQERHERPNKYQWTEHAERNAIYNASRLGVSLVGCSLYSTLFPCIDCTRGIIQTGIEKIYTKEPDFEHHKYGKEWQIAIEMLNESNVKIFYI